MKTKERTTVVGFDELEVPSVVEAGGLEELAGGAGAIVVLLFGSCCCSSAQRQICDQDERTQKFGMSDVLLINAELALRLRELGDPRWFILNRGGQEMSILK